MEEKEENIEEKEENAEEKQESVEEKEKIETSLFYKKRNRAYSENNK